MRYRLRTLLIVQSLLAVYWSAYAASATPKFVATPNGKGWDIVASPDYRWGGRLSKSVFWPAAR